MACLSPASYLFWAVSSVLFECFLVYHLWSFDRFKCLRYVLIPLHVHSRSSWAPQMEQQQQRSGRCLQALHDCAPSPRLSLICTSRALQYSYLINIPLLIVFSVGFVVIKYQDGYVDYPLYGSTL